MIVFDLNCCCGCQFEGWFRDHHDYERQQADGMIRCPRCGEDQVHKILSPVATVGRQRQADNPSPKKEEILALMTQLRGQLTELKTYIDKNFEDVGSQLASTALKIRYGVEEARNVRGVATAQEEEMLKKEGIKLVKIPVLKVTDEGQ